MKTLTVKSKTGTQQPRHHRTSRQTQSAAEGIHDRPEAIAQRTMNQGLRVQALVRLQDTIHNSPRQVAQRRDAAQMQTRADRGAGAATPILLQRLVDRDTDAREGAPRAAAAPGPVVQRFQLRKWQVKEQVKLEQLLSGEGPWDTDSLSLETRRQLHALLSEDQAFSSRKTDLAQLKRSIESAEPSTLAIEGAPQVGPKVTKTVVSTPVEPQNALPRKTTPTVLTTPDLSLGEQTGVRERVLDKVEAVDPVKTEGRKTDPHHVRVARAMASIPQGTETSEETVMAALIAEYGSAAAVVEPSKTPEFASTLLEAIRSRQAKGWVDATAMVKPSSRMALPGKIDDWTIRHYTNKATVTLGEAGPTGLRKVLAVNTPPFDELLSMVTLTAMRMHGLGNYPFNLSANQKLHTNSSSKTSGHTSALDWKNIGNVGDTFYALFYKGQSATGVVPAFITDALYYAEWKITDFGDAWASSDWLSKASGSKNANAPRPSGQSVEGPIRQVIAHQLGMPTFQANAMTDDATVKTTTASRLTANFENFEVKKHGSVKLQTGGWQPANPGKINEIKSGYYDATDNWMKG